MWTKIQNNSFGGLPQIVWAILFFLSFSFTLNAQKSFSLSFRTTDQESGFLEKNVKFESTFSDSIQVNKIISNVLSQLYDKAWLEASLDSLHINNRQFVAYLHIGQPYQWVSLKNGNIPPAFLAQAGQPERLFDHKPFYYKEMVDLQEALLLQAEHNGYPFASVRLDSIRIRDGMLSARLYMKKNRLVLLGGTRIKGDIRLSEGYLENYLGLRAGSLYDKRKILKVRDRLRELPFLSVKQDPTVTFEKKEAWVNLFLEPKRASRFDFLIGFLPNNQETGRMLLTGTFTADLHNQFGLGEKIYAEFQQLRPQTQELDLRFLYPYTFNLPFGFDFKFDLYKRDTSYLDVEFDLGIQYLFEGGNYLKAFWNNTSTTLLNINEAQVISQKALPENLDVSNAAFGLEYNHQQLDYRFNPRKGWGVFLRGSAGFKRIKPNNSIVNLSDENAPEFDFSSLYDSLKLKTFQYKLTGRLEAYLPLFKRSALKGAVNSGYIISEENLFRNELFFIGGNRLLRGFDEESIFASLYTVFTLEYRFVTGLNSYIYLFGDLAYVEQKTADTKITDSPTGFGAGMTFDTKIGLFGISYALGRQRENPIDFRSAKIHFGYVSYF